MSTLIRPQGIQWETRAAGKGESQGLEYTERPFSEKELKAIGSHVTEEVCRRYGYMAVESCTVVEGNVKLSLESSENGRIHVLARRGSRNGWLHFPDEKPGSATDYNPALHMMEEGSVFDVAYWLDNSQMGTRALKLWIGYREMLENSCAGEYLNAPSLEDFHKHPEDIIPANQIERIEHLIANVHEIHNSRDIEIRYIVGNEVNGWLHTRKKRQPRENRTSGGDPHSPAGNETTDG